MPDIAMLVRGVDISSKWIAQPLASRGEQDKAQITGRGLLIACSNAVALLQPADGPFHKVALPVQHPVIVARYRAVAPPWNHRFGSLHHDVPSQLIIVVAPDRQHIVGVASPQQPLRLRSVMGLSRGQAGSQQAALGTSGDRVGPYVGSVQVHATRLSPF